MTEQKNTTRETIIRKGAELIHLKGFHSTGLQEILAKTGIPKGSFYFYFKSKEDFGLEVIDYFTENVSAVFKNFLNNETLPPVIRIENLMNFFEVIFKKTGCKLGCPIGNLSLELSDGNERFRKKLNESIRILIGIVESFLTEGKGKGNFNPDMNISETAQFFFHGFEGALLHMKVMKSVEPLVVFKNNLKKNLQISSEQKSNNKGD